MFYITRNMAKTKEPTYKLMFNSTNLSDSPIFKFDCRMLIYKYLVFVPCQMCIVLLFA
jgi:hypothetical protein